MNGIRPFTFHRTGGSDFPLPNYLEYFILVLRLGSEKKNHIFASNKIHGQFKFMKSCIKIMNAYGFLFL